jgi:integrase/recombinase XerC
MDEVRKRFLNYIQYEKRLSKNTLIAYEQDLNQFSLFLHYNFQHQDMLTANSSMIRSWTISLIEKKDTATTVNRKISCLKSFYKFLLKNGSIHQNPTSKIIRPKTPKRLPKDISAGKLQDIKDKLELSLTEDNFDARRDYTMFMTFYLCGLRRSELIDMQWQQIDLSLKQISVIGKGKKQRFIPINFQLIELLYSYKQEISDQNIIAENDHVFILNNGKQLYPNFVYRTIKKYLMEVTSQKGIGPHSLRHSFATHLLNEGAELNAIKGLLGHSSLASTQVYTHSSIEKLKHIHKLSHPKS